MMPRAVSAKLELLMEGINAATKPDRFEAKLRAVESGTYPVSAITLRIYSRVADETDSPALSARETVIAETPANLAISDIVAGRTQSSPPSLAEAGLLSDIAAAIVPGPYLQEWF